MPKRLLRSIIEFDSEISSENLVRNFQRLRKAVDVGQLDWGRPEDEKLYKYALGFFIQHFELPSAQTCLDYFQSVDNVEVIERLKDVQVEKPYARTNFVHLLRTLQEDQARLKAVALLKETHEILVKGIEDKKSGVVQKGVEDAILHFTKRSQEIRVNDHNVQIHGDIRQDAERMKEEYTTAENDKGKVIGVLSGINELDESCKGAKKGELWIHAAFPGELKTMLASNWCYNAVTRFKKNVVYVSFEMPRDQIRRNIYTIHTSNARFLNQGYQGIDYRSIRDGNMTKAEKEFYFDCVVPDFTTNPTYGTFEVVTPDREWTMDDVRSEIELLHKEFEVGLVVLDHGQWIEAKKTKKNKDYTIELNSVITDAKRLALNFDHNSGIPVLMLFQINRTGKTDADKNEGVYKMNALTYANNCLIDGTMVSTEYGLIPISAVTTGTRVWSSCGWKSVLANYANGVRPVVEIRTDRGLVISATADHRFRTLGSNGVQWTAAVDLVGSYVLGSTNVPVEGRATILPKVEFHPYEHLERAGVSIQAPEVLDKNLAYLLGAHAGDGSLSSGHVGFCGHKSEKAVLARLQTSFKAAFNQDLALWYAKATKTFYLDIGSQPLVRWFRAIGSDRGETGIPPCILESSTECQREFLRGLWDTDGHINTQGVLSLGQKASKRKTLEDMQLVLLCLGIDSSILHKVEKLNGKEYPQEVLILRSRRGRELFASLVGFTEPHKQRRLEHFVNKFAGSDRRASLEKWPVAGIYRRMLLKHGWFTTKGAEQIKLLNLFLGPSKTLRLSTIADHLYGSHGGNETRKAYSLAQTLVRKKLLERTARGEYTGSVENERFYFPRKCNVALHKTKRHQLVSRGAIEAALETLAMRGVADPDAELLTRLLQNVVPQRVVSVTPAGEGQVYDLEVTGDHEYAAGGLLVHNCEKTADVITTTYLNTDMRAAGMTKFTNLKNRDNPLFDPFSANVNFGWRRISSGKRMEPQGFSVDHHSSYLGATEQV